MKCLTVCLLLLSVYSQPSSSLRLHQSDSPLYTELQTAVQSADLASQLVTKDLKLIKLVLQGAVSQQDGEELGKVIEDDREKLGKAKETLEEAVRAVENANLRAEMNILYRSSGETLDQITDIEQELIAVAEEIEAKVPQTAPFPEKSRKPTADLASTTPSVDQLLEITACLETLIRAHKGANELLATIQPDGILTPESSQLTHRKSLRGTEGKKAEMLQRQKELVTETQDKVAKAMTALQESARLLSHKSQLIDSLQTQILSSSQ